jgi:hypothetical protein
MFHLKFGGTPVTLTEHFRQPGGTPLERTDVLISGPNGLQGSAGVDRLTLLEPSALRAGQVDGARALSLERRTTYLHPVRTIHQRRLRLSWTRRVVQMPTQLNLANLRPQHGRRLRARDCYAAEP